MQEFLPKYSSLVVSFVYTLVKEYTLHKFFSLLSTQLTGFFYNTQNAPFCNEAENSQYNFQKRQRCNKEARNYILCIIRAWSLLCSIRINLRIQSEYRKIWTKKNSVFGNFSRSVCLFYFEFCLFYFGFLYNAAVIIVYVRTNHSGILFSP